MNGSAITHVRTTTKTMAEAEAESKAPAAAAAKRYTCDICSKEVSSLSQHKRIHLPREYKCEPCDLLFTLKPHLKRHQESNVHRTVIAAALRDASVALQEETIILPPPSSPPPDQQQEEEVHIDAIALRIVQQEAKVSGMISQMDTIKQCLVDLDIQQRAKWTVLVSLEEEYGREATILAELRAKLGGATVHVCNASEAACVAEYSVEPCGHCGCELWKNQVLQTKLCPMCGQQVIRVVQNIM